MTARGMTFEEWHALSLGEQQYWIDWEHDREHRARRMVKALRGKDKKKLNEFTISAAYIIYSRLL